MAIAWGDAWTNMIQPFWALPALAIAGLGAKDIMGYCVITLSFTGVVISCGFFFLFALSCRQYALKLYGDYFLARVSGVEKIW